MLERLASSDFASRSCEIIASATTRPSAGSWGFDECYAAGALGITIGALGFLICGTYLAMKRETGRRLNGIRINREY